MAICNTLDPAHEEHFDVQKCVQSSRVLNLHCGHLEGAGSERNNLLVVIELVVRGTECLNKLS